MAKLPSNTLDVRKLSAARQPRSGFLTRGFRVRTLLVVVGVILIVATCFSAYLWLNRSTPSLTGEAELKSTVAKVSRHYLLPSDETPALATVTDPSKLTTPFLKKAKVGDKILIYQSNKIAIIYRPGIDKVVIVGPVSIDSPKKPTGRQ